MAINRLLQVLFDCLYGNTTIDFFEEDGLFKFEFHGEISPMNLNIILSHVPLISSYGYVCSIGSVGSHVVLRIEKYDKECLSSSALV